MRIVRRPSSPAQDLLLAFRHFLRRRACDLAGVALIVFSIITAIALVTWSVTDPSLTHATDGRVANWLGVPGAIFSDMAMQLLGLGSVAWLLPVAVWGVALVSRRPLHGMKWRIPLWLLGAVAAAGVASSLPAPGGWPLPTGLGGVIGDAMRSAAGAVFGFLGGVAPVLGALALAACAILALSAACGYGFDEAPAAGDPGETEEDGPRIRSARETDDEPGLGIVSLGAIVHGFMMFKAAIARRRMRRQHAAASLAPARQAPQGPSRRVEPAVFPEPAAPFATPEPSFATPAAPAAQDAAQPSRVRMPPSWDRPEAPAQTRLGPIEPPWRREEAPSPVHEAFAPARHRTEAAVHAVAPAAAPAVAGHPVAAPAAQPVCAPQPAVAPQQRLRQEVAPQEPLVAAAPRVNVAATAGTAAAPAVATTATAARAEPPAAAIAAAAELSSRFAALVRKRRAAAEAASGPAADAGQAALADAEEQQEQTDADVTAERGQPEAAPQTFVLHRRRRQQVEEAGAAQAGDGAPDDADDNDQDDAAQAATDDDDDLPPEAGVRVTASAPSFRPAPLPVSPPTELKNAVPANDWRHEHAAVATAPARVAPAPARTAGAVTADSYQLPDLALLSEPRQPSASARLSVDALEQNATLLEGVLEDFGVRGEIINVRPGPVVTLYELEPAPGTKSSKIISLADDIARSMSAISARVAVVPGRNAIGIELPNAHRETVFLRELLASDEFINSKSRLGLCLGKTIGGEPVIADLARMPHLLVAGTTGSGKSVAINTMILSLLYRLRPDECRLIMVDPKMLELSIYDGIPHLLTPVVTDPKKAVVALKWAVREMEDRYKKMSKMGVRNIDGFNARVAEAKRKGEVITRTIQTGFDKETGEPIFEEEVMDLDPLPYIVVIVDEMADLMMVAGKEIEGTIQRLAQMARAAGIHVILATQRPSVDVITGTIKANFPTRISFQVTSKIDSRTILGEQGAEQLLGQGDMLYMAGGGRITRVHGPFVSDNEVEKVVAHLKSQGRPQYLDAVTAMDESEADDGGSVFDQTGMGASGAGDLFEQAVAIVLRDQKASTSYIQRRLQIGYNRAASLMERMELEGIVGPANHAGKREILVQAPRQDEE